MFGVVHNVDLKSPVHFVSFKFKDPVISDVKTKPKSQVMLKCTMSFSAIFSQLKSGSVGGVSDPGIVDGALDPVGNEVADLCVVQLLIESVVGNGVGL